VGDLRFRRWIRRLAVVAAVVGVAAMIRDRMLAANATRYDLPN